MLLVGVRILPSFFHVSTTPLGVGCLTSTWHVYFTMHIIVLCLMYCLSVLHTSYSVACTRNTMFMWYTMWVLHMLDYSCIILYAIDPHHIMLHMIVYMPYWLLCWLDTWLICIYWLLAMYIRCYVILVVCFRHYMIVLLTWSYYVHDWICILYCWICLCVLDALMTPMMFRHTTTGWGVIYIYCVVGYFML